MSEPGEGLLRLLDFSTSPLLTQGNVPLSLLTSLLLPPFFISLLLFSLLLIIITPIFIYPLLVIITSRLTPPSLFLFPPPPPPPGPLGHGLYTLSRQGQWTRSTGQLSSSTSSSSLSSSSTTATTTTLSDHPAFTRSNGMKKCEEISLTLPGFLIEATAGSLPPTKEINPLFWHYHNTSSHTQNQPSRNTIYQPINTPFHHAPYQPILTSSNLPLHSTPTR